MTSILTCPASTLTPLQDQSANPTPNPNPNQCSLASHLHLPCLLILASRPRPSELASRHCLSTSPSARQPTHITSWPYRPSTTIFSTWPSLRLLHCVRCTCTSLHKPRLPFPFRVAAGIAPRSICDSCASANLSSSTRNRRAHRSSTSQSCNHERLCVTCQ